MRFFSGSVRRSIALDGLSPRRNLGGLSRLLAWNGPLVTLLALVLAVAAGLLLVQLPLLDAVLFVGLVVGGVATVIEPLVGLAAALFLGPLRAYLRTEVPLVPAQIAQFFVALALAAWLARGLVRRNLRIPHPPLLVPLVVFLGAALISLWGVGEVPVHGVNELIKWVQIVLVFLFVSQTLAAGMEALTAGMETRPTSGGEALAAGMETCPTSGGEALAAGMETRPTSGGEARRTSCVAPRRLRWLLGALLLTGLFQASVGVWQFGLRGEGPDHFAITVLGERFYRAYGTFEQPNPYAGYVGMTLSLAIGVAIGVLIDYRHRETKGRILFLCPLVPLSPCLPVLLLVTIAMGAALAMSWSRGAWLGFGAAVAAMAIAVPRRTRWGLLLVAVLVVGGLVLYATGLLPASVTARLTGFAPYVQFEDVRGVGISDANYAVVERLAHWQAALQMFRHNLWTGVGFGCYEPAYADFALINWPIALGHAHNYYLNVAAETGLVGLVAYLLLWGAVFWHTWRATRRAGGFLRGLAVGLLGAWTHLSVHHLLDKLYVNNVHLHVGVLLGVLAFINRRVSESASQRISESASQRVSESASRQIGKSTDHVALTIRPSDQPTK